MSANVGDAKSVGEAVQIANTGVQGGAALLRSQSQTTTASPKLMASNSVPVSYTTKSGEVIVTRKMLSHEPSFVLSQAPDAPSIGVAIIGYRRFGKKHLKDVFENKACMVRFIIEYETDLADQAKREVKEMGLQRCEVISDPSKLEYAVNHKDISVVIISCALERKKMFVTASLKAGKTCLCDRPLATTTQDVRELFDLARASNAILLTNLPGRPGKSFTPVIMSLISSSSHIKIQRQLSATAQSDFSKAPPITVTSEETKAMILDVAMHDVGAMNFCMCMRPTEVSASISPQHKGVCVVNLTYPNGCKVEVLSAYGQETFDVQQYTVFGDRLSDMRRVDHMNTCDMRAHGLPSDAGLTDVGKGSQEPRSIRFTQIYDAANRDALEQAYAFSAGHKEHALRVRPYLMEQNCCDNLIIAEAAMTSLLNGSKVVPTKYW